MPQSGKGTVVRYHWAFPASFSPHATSCLAPLPLHSSAVICARWYDEFLKALCHISAAVVIFRGMLLLNQHQQLHTLLSADKRLSSAKSQAERSGIMGVSYRMSGAHVGSPIDSCTQSHLLTATNIRIMFLCVGGGGSLLQISGTGEISPLVCIFFPSH